MNALRAVDKMHLMLYSKMFLYIFLKNKVKLYTSKKAHTTTMTLCL